MCGGPESIPVLHYSANNIFWFFGINELIWVISGQKGILSLERSAEKAQTLTELERRKSLMTICQG